VTATDPRVRPRLARGVRLRADPVRGGHVLLAPERVVAANGSAVAILELCDGARGPAEIVEALCRRYDADPARVAADVDAVLADLAEKRLIDL
jgi:pyrroloquinoline quinone biosynthesis protein D